MRLLLKLIRCFLSIRNLPFKTRTAPRYWLKLTDIDDEENKYILNK